MFGPLNGTIDSYFITIVVVQSQVESTPAESIDVEQCSNFLEQLSQRIRNGNFSSTDESIKIPNLATLEQTLDEIDDDIKTQNQDTSANSTSALDDRNFIAAVGNKIETQFTKVKQCFVGLFVCLFVFCFIFIIDFS